VYPSLRSRVAHITPQSAFVPLGLVLGLLFLILTPPFQVPDEAQHFYRAFQVSEGRFFDLVYLVGDKDRNGDITSGAYGALLPKSLAAIVRQSDLVTTRSKRGAKIRPSKIIAGFGIPLDSQEREYLPVAPYPVIPYVAQAAGILLGRILRLPPLALFYMGRLGSIAAWLLLTYLAIKITPVLKWSYFLLAMMPMTLYLAASNSCDSFVIALSFLMSGIVFRWIYDDKKQNICSRDVTYFSAMAVGFGLSKAVYLVWLFPLILLVPAKKFGGCRQRAIAIATVAFAGVFTYWIWGAVVNRVTLNGPSVQLAEYGVDQFSTESSRQIEFVRSQPFEYIRTVRNTIFGAEGLIVLWSFFGFFGWMTTPIPWWVPPIYIAALLTNCEPDSFVSFYLSAQPW
jgi:hypothetical protein